MVDIDHSSRNMCTKYIQLLPRLNTCLTCIQIRSFDAEFKHLILFMHEQKFFIPVWNIVYWYYFPTLSYFLSLNQVLCSVVYIPSSSAISSFPPLTAYIVIFPECSAYPSSYDSTYFHKLVKYYRNCF